MKRILTQAVMMLCLTVIISSCGNADGEGENNELNTVDANKENDHDGTNLDEESFDNEVSFPSAILVAQILNNSGMTYMDGLVNSTDKASQYNSLLRQKLNFGAYSADLAYLVMNEKYGQIKGYMAAIRDLSAQTGMDKIFNSEDLVDRFERNANNRDSLRNILIDINIRTQEILETDPVARLEATVHVAGAWVEGMYLGSKTVVETKNKELGTAVVEQMNILNGIIGSLKKQTDMSSDLDKFITMLEDLYSTFNNFESVKELNNDDSGYYSSPELTEQDLEELASKVEQVRNYIVNV